MSCCESYISDTHDVNDDVTGSQSRSIFKIAMSSIFELKRRSKRQNIGNADGYIAGIFKFRYYFRLKIYTYIFQGDDVIDDGRGWLQRNEQRYHD